MFKERSYYVYILASQNNGTIYIGVTNNLIKRITQHKNKTITNSFTDEYNIDKLVYYELFSNIGRALYREKQLKKWQRKWKMRLIEENNFYWRDLYETLF
ncbi:MAG: GIY-YIG nuclease family protein [Candidatus Falkowbacteria bacterium]